MWKTEIEQRGGSRDSWKPSVNTGLMPLTNVGDGGQRGSRKVSKFGSTFEGEL